MSKDTVVAVRLRVVCNGSCEWATVWIFLSPIFLLIFLFPVLKTTLLEWRDHHLLLCFVSGEIFGQLSHSPCPVAYRVFDMLPKFGKALVIAFGDK